MELYFHPEIEKELITLDASESMHCVKVMRLKPGAMIQVADGKGTICKAEILNDNSRACQLRIISRDFHEDSLGYFLEIAIAPTKNMDRLEWFVEKATEIGISRISPIICERSERRHIRTDRLEKIALSAMKQSVKSWLPEISEPVSFSDWMKQPREGNRLIAHCFDSLKTEITQLKIEDSVCLLIGPEGDFSPEEVEIARSNGYKEISLGDFRLRTETAGLMAVTAVHLMKRMAFQGK